MLEETWLGFSIAEGSGSKIYSTDGLAEGTISTPDIDTLRAGVRPEGSPDPRIANGYWHIDGDDTFYPFPIATSTKGEPWEAGTYKVMETPEIINADKLQDSAGPYLCNGSGVAIGFTWAGWMSDGVMNYNKQLYGCIADAAWFYDTTATESQDIDIKDWSQCWTISTIVDSNNETVVDSNGETVVREEEN